MKKEIIQKAFAFPAPAKNILTSLERLQQQQQQQEEYDEEEEQLEQHYEL